VFSLTFSLKQRKCSKLSALLFKFKTQFHSWATGNFWAGRKWPAGHMLLRPVYKESLPPSLNYLMISIIAKFGNAFLFIISTNIISNYVEFSNSRPKSNLSDTHRSHVSTFYKTKTKMKFTLSDTRFHRNSVSSLREWTHVIKRTDILRTLLRNERI
jgi:hypothetical protein